MHTLGTIELSNEYTSLDSLKSIFSNLDSIIIILDEKKQVKILNEKAKRYFNCRKVDGMIYDDFCKIVNKKIFFYPKV